MNARDYGALVENRLNVKFDGQSLYNRSSAAERVAATATAARIRGAFGRC